MLSATLSTIVLTAPHRKDQPRMSPDRAVMPGQVWGLATHDSTGPIFVTSYAGRNLDATVLTAVDPAGGVIWQ